MRSCVARYFSRFLFFNMLREETSYLLDYVLRPVTLSLFDEKLVLPGMFSDCHSIS